MNNILSLNKELIEILKPEAARLLGVDSKQLFVDFKQDVLYSAPSEILDFTNNSKVGFLLDLTITTDDGVEGSSGIDEVTVLVTDASFRNGSITFSNYTQSNIFFKKISVFNQWSFYYVVTYLEFRAL